VHVAVDQAGDDAPTIQVDASDSRRRSLKNVGIASDSNEPPIRNGNGSCTRILPVKGGNFAIEEDEISRVSRALRSTCSGLRAKGCRKGSQAEEQFAAICQTDHFGGSLVRRRFRQNGMVDFFGRYRQPSVRPVCAFFTEILFYSLRARGGYREPFARCWPRAVQATRMASAQRSWERVRQRLERPLKNRPVNSECFPTAIEALERAFQLVCDVRFGSKGDVCDAIRHVRFTPNSDIDCVLLWAISGCIFSHPLPDLRR
jgi:hypothetical protein